MLPTNKIDDLIEKHSLLEKQLSSGDIDKKKFAEKSKEYSDLNEVINEAKRYQKYDKEKVELEKIINDTSSEQDFKDMDIK